MSEKHRKRKGRSKLGLALVGVEGAEGGSGEGAADVDAIVAFAGPAFLLEDDFDPLEAFFAIFLRRE